MKNYSVEKIKNCLFDSISQLLDQKGEYLNNPDKAFSRTQKISFRDTMLFPMLTSSESTPVEILDFFPESNLPSESAMIYRRNQVKICAFKKLFTTFTNAMPQKKTFHGMRLIACDGTRLGTPYNPKDSDSFVNSIKDRKGFNQYHINTFYDILNDIFLDVVIQKYFSMDEKLAFREMLKNLSKDMEAILVADRGYSSFNNISHAMNSGQYFVIRLQTAMGKNLFCDLKEAEGMSSFDIEDDIHIGRVRTKESKALKNYHFLNSTKHYDAIPKGCKNIDCFHVRLVKFQLSGGMTEYLITNLPKSQFSLEDLKEIYRLRWQIETAYRYLKYAAGMVHSHSLKQSFIFQEVYAKLTFYNFCAAVRATITTSKSDTKKYTYEIEKTYLIKVCNRYLKKKIDDLEDLVQKRMVPVRAGRTFERNIRRQHSDTLQYR